jgi:hypothetical protein
MQSASNVSWPNSFMARLTHVSTTLVFRLVYPRSGLMRSRLGEWLCLCLPFFGGPM